MKAGFIGLGHMGLGMAANLLKAGHELTVYNRSPGRAIALAEQGAKVAANVAEACQVEAVITMLADDDAVLSTAFGPNGIVASLPKGALHISCSTIGTAISAKLAAAHEQAGQQYCTAPVFGRPDAAARGELFIVAAGSKDALERAKPLLDAMGQRTFTISGKTVDANLVKLSGNFLIASVIEALGEAFALIGKAGIDKKAYLEILTSTLFNAPVYKTYGRLIADGAFEPAGFAAPLGAKDIRLTLAAGEELSVPLPLASLIRDRFLTLLAQHGEALDWSAIGGLAARDAGLKQ